MKKLDSPGMKYTNWKIRVLGLFATTLLGLGQVRAQSAYVSGTPTLNGASPAASTESADEPQNAIITIHSRVNEVNVLFIATDKHGKFVRDLNQGDFSILDDHKPPQAILNFRRETDLPLHMGLLVDTSGSVGSRSASAARTTESTTAIATSGTRPVSLARTLPLPDCAPNGATIASRNSATRLTGRPASRSAARSGGRSRR